MTTLKQSDRPPKLTKLSCILEYEDFTVVTSPITLKKLGKIKKKLFPFNPLEK